MSSIVLNAFTAVYVPVPRCVVQIVQYFLLKKTKIKGKQKGTDGTRFEIYQLISSRVTRLPTGGFKLNAVSFIMIGCSLTHLTPYPPPPPKAISLVCKCDAVLKMEIM